MGVSKSQVSKWKRGKYTTTRLGRTPSLDEEDLRAVANHVRSAQRQRDDSVESSVYEVQSILAAKNGRPYKHGVPSHETKRRNDRLLEAMTRRDQLLPDANPEHGPIGKANAIATVARRQGAITGAAMASMHDARAKIMIAYPKVADEPAAFLEVDESPQGTRGEKKFPRARVFHDRLMSRHMGVSRSSVIGDGVNTVSLIQAVNASQREDFDNTDDPIWYVSGKHVQPNWSKGDMPPGVSREWVEKQAIFMTPGGVATGESNLQVLRYIFVRHRKRLTAIGYDAEIILGIDCPASRCIKWMQDGTFEVGEELQDLLDEFDVKLCPYVHNSTTAVCTLDADYFKVVNSLTGKVYKALPRIEKNPTLSLNPYSLNVEINTLTSDERKSGLKLPCVAVRSCNLESKLSFRTIILTFAILHTHHKAALNGSARKGWRITGT